MVTRIQRNSPCSGKVVLVAFLLHNLLGDDWNVSCRVMSERPNGPSPVANSTFMSATLPAALRESCSPPT